MTDKERLEEIKLKFNNTIDTMLYVPYKDMKFLIEQVERVQDLKIMLKVLGERNQRYKHALEFYADPMIWREGNRIKGNTFEMPLANKDNGHKARKALEGTDNE